jgi:hypothetical protein
MVLPATDLNDDGSRPTIGFTCRRDKQDSTACQPRNLRKSPPHTHAEGGQVQTVLAGSLSTV